jgi:hypothetical protein
LAEKPGRESRIRSGMPPGRSKASPAPWAWRWCRRRPAVAGLRATLALALVAGLVGLSVLLKQAETARTRAAERCTPKVAWPSMRDVADGAVEKGVPAGA